MDSEEPIAVQLPDAALQLWTKARLSFEPAVLRETLLDQVDWREEDIVLFGKRHKQPRLIAWYGDENAHYSYSGVGHTPNPWTPCLVALRADVERITGHRFNSVLLNLYRDHRDSMGMHADDEPELGDQPVIASLSLGEERTLSFKHRFKKALPTHKLPLPDGSLLLMSGQTQRFWKHGIAKRTKPCGARINLTFRMIYPSGSTGAR